MSGEIHYYIARVKNGYKLVDGITGDEYVAQLLHGLLQKITELENERTAHI